ncbi:MAG: hypothetical protein ACPGSB_03820 [Opitutales bacterium]
MIAEHGIRKFFGILTNPMSEPFFEHPILNSPYEYPDRHWELDKEGQDRSVRPLKYD